MIKKSIDTTVSSWLREATEQLTLLGIPRPHLDTELLLAHTLHKSRTWLHAHGDETIQTHLRTVADARLALRAARVPIAYIIGHKEFYGRLFDVTPATLIPRPESEMIMTLLDTLLDPHASRLLDVGTGSGCLGITAKLEHPELAVTLCDISSDALKIARRNAQRLYADVQTAQSDLLQAIDGRFDVILANLPYVDRSWDVSTDTAHEPADALYAEDGGLALIKQLLTQAVSHISRGGLILLEADPCQHDSIVTYAQQAGYRHITTSGYIIAVSYSQSN